MHGFFNRRLVSQPYFLCCQRSNENVLQAFGHDRIVCGQGDAPTHDLGKFLWIQRRSVRLCQPVWYIRLAIFGSILISCAKCVQELVRNDDVVASLLAAAGVCVDNTYHAFLQTN